MEYIIHCTDCGEPKYYKNANSYKAVKCLAKKNGYSYCSKCFGKRASIKTKGKKNPSYKRSSNIEKKFFKPCPKCDQSQGYSTEKLMKEAIRLNTLCNTCSGIVNRKGHKMNNKISHERRLELIAKREGFTSYETYQDTLKGFKRYLLRVWRLTYKQPLESLENFNRRGMSGIPGAYQIDHKISVKDGYLHNLPESDIASINNLRMIPWEENIKKSSSSLWHL